MIEPAPRLPVTLLVPTFNRPQFVARLLRYYAGLRFGGRIAIGDSSDALRFDQTRREIDQYAGVLDVVHVAAPGLTIGPCLKRLTDATATAYAVVVPDDDFIVPAALARCIAFLDGHPDYVAAHGAGITMTLDSNGLHGQVVSCAHYPQTVLEDQTAAGRLATHSSRYTVSLFSVHRTESWHLMMRDVDDVPDVSFSAEVLPCYLSVVLGKIKELDDLYLIRQSHNLRIKLPTMFDWVATREWFPSYERSAESVAAELVRLDGLSPEDARDAVKEGFRQYVGLGIGLRRTLGGNEWLLSAARGAWRFLQRVRPGPKDEWSLEALLDPASPHNPDFMPVYRALVNPPPPATTQAAGPV